MAEPFFKDCGCGGDKNCIKCCGSGRVRDYAYEDYIMDKRHDARREEIEDRKDRDR